MANAKTAKIEDLDTSFGASSTAMSRTETLFTAVEHPRRGLATDTELLQFIRNTTDAIWQQADISDSQMKDIALNCCAEARPSTQDELNREVATWTLDYFQQRMERCLECLETTFQGTTSVDEEMSPMLRPARRENDPEIIESVDPVFSNTNASLQPRLHEDIESALGELVTSEVTELRRESETDCRSPSSEFPEVCKRAPLGDKHSVLNEGDDTNLSMAHHTNAKPVEEIEPRTQAHPRFSPDDLKSECTSEEGNLGQSGTADVPIDTTATPTLRDAGHSSPNQPDGRTCKSSDLPNNLHTRPKSIGMLVLPSEQTSTRSNPETERRNASTQKASLQPRHSARCFGTQGSGGVSDQRVHKSKSRVEPEYPLMKTRGASEKHLYVVRGPPT